MLVAVRVAFGDDAAGGFGYEHGEPVNHGIGDAVDGGLVANAVDFHRK